MDSLRDIKSLEGVGYVGTNRQMEVDVLSDYDWIEFHPLALTGFKRELRWTSLFKNLLLLIKLAIALCKMLYFIIKMRPSIILGTGGYSSFPPLFWGILLGIPTFILEPNVVPGLTNRLLAPWAKKIFIAHRSTRKFFTSNKSLVTGVPIRKDVLSAQFMPPAYDLFGLDPTKRTVLIVGGSQGSKLLNEAVLKASKKIKEMKEIQIILVAGREREATCLKRVFNKEEIDNVNVLTFIHEMGKALQIADLVISRAGACTLAEITALGKPSILVPWANAACNHQYMNALYLAKKGASLVVNENDLACGRVNLAKLIRRILLDEEYYYRMQAKSNSLGKPDATKQIKKEVEAFING